MEDFSFLHQLFKSACAGSGPGTPHNQEDPEQASRSPREMPTQGPSTCYVETAQRRSAWLHRLGGSSFRFVFCGTLATGCAVSHLTADLETNADTSGGNSSMGGTQASAGTQSAGGMTSSGGSTSIRGATSPGGSTSIGGTTGNGGTVATGGNHTSGGQTSTGGAVSFGGTPSTGGSKSSGGTTSSGGSTTIGGAPITGGAPATGGFKGTGGLSTGGMPATGGAPNGGAISAATGGSCSRAANILSDFENTEGTTWQVYAVPAASGNAPAGIWYAFKDSGNCASLNQLPKLPMTPATMMASAASAEGLPTADSRYSGCNHYALHSSISGCQTYSGFGASLSPSSTVGSTLKNPIDYSNYDGISFWIKAGSGPQGPLYLEFVTKECVPSSDGGTATSSVVDQYNCHGHLLPVSGIPSTWTQMFVPFYTTGSRWFPIATSSSSSARCTSSDFCEAPVLDTRHLLAIQFSLEDPFNTTPTQYSSYDVWIDDVALYKFSDTPANQGLATWTQNGAANPFPANKTFAGCPSPKSNDGKVADGRLLQDAYVKWKTNFVKADGSNVKVVSPEIDNGATVSEGIAYGMLIAVYVGDKALFDGLYGYWKAHVQAGSLMTWKIPGGTGSATDADEDAAFALLEASKQWPSGGYSATTMISDVWSHDIDPTSLLPTGGSNYNNSTSLYVTNPSYFAPAMYREFAKVDTGHNWAGVITAVYNALDGAISGSMGLVPAWCKTNCTGAGTNGAATDGEYQYDSHRVPWRIGIDACWNSEAKAATYLGKIIGFFNSQAGAAGLSVLGDIYKTDGTADTINGADNSMSLVGCMGAGAMSVSSTNGQGGLAVRAWQFILEGQYTANYTFTNGNANTKPRYNYYNATVGLLTGLTMSGNFYPM
jgi:endoglucanase